MTMIDVRRSALRGVAAVGIAAGLVAGTAGGALAHECFNASRSDQGNAMAGTKSQAWASVPLHVVLTEFIGLPEPLAACVEEKAPAAGIPSSFVFGIKQAQGQDGVIAEHNKNMDAKGLGSNGKGIDHGELAYGDAIGALIGQCSA
ncbi:hypothetical protein [Luteipulveratus halotolerans]|uniref:Uncharacterized protein n=1 Tax=Luteipulveratus halotolerans TaxID=1631356 RepID=A0A0L6CEK2_9MICO|nr:hypothetical protein [Luteipulveratus halotolerans]KNX36242.1 hypothetical protein VV01_02335 [Luteipulveratus halotolerans]